MRIIFKKRAGDTSLINKRLTLDVENPDLLKKIEFFTVKLYKLYKLNKLYKFYKTFVS